MKIGIISDTHDQIQNLKKAISVFNKENVKLVYHLGDFCSPFTVTLFSSLKCNVKAVFGNNDADIFKFLKIKPKNVKFYDKFYVDKLFGEKIALYHGDPEQVVNNLIKSNEYDIVLRGHNHIAQIKKINKTLVINPGNLIGPIENFKWSKPCVAIYDFIKKEAKIITL